MSMAILCLIAIGGPVALVGVFLRGMRRMPTHAVPDPRGGDSIADHPAE